MIVFHILLFFVAAWVGLTGMLLWSIYETRVYEWFKDEFPKYFLFGVFLIPVVVTVMSILFKQ